MNQLYRQINTGRAMQMPQVQNNISNTKNLIQALNRSKNPSQLFYNLAKGNPRLQSILDMVSKSGKSPKELFFSEAKRMGVDANAIVKELGIE